MSRSFMKRSPTQTLILHGLHSLVHFFFFSHVASFPFVRSRSAYEIGVLGAYAATSNSTSFLQPGHFQPGHFLPKHTFTASLRCAVHFLPANPAPSDPAKRGQGDQEKGSAIGLGLQRRLFLSPTLSSSPTPSASEQALPVLILHWVLSPSPAFSSRLLPLLYSPSTDVTHPIAPSHVGWGLCCTDSSRQCSSPSAPQAVIQPSCDYLSPPSTASAPNLYNLVPSPCGCYPSKHPAMSFSQESPKGKAKMSPTHQPPTRLRRKAA